MFTDEHFERMGKIWGYHQFPSETGQDYRNRLMLTIYPPKLTRTHPDGTQEIIADPTPPGWRERQAAQLNKFLTENDLTFAAYQDYISGVRPR